MAKIIIANWKMRLSVLESLALAKKLDVKLKNSKRLIVLCPDFLSLPLVAAVLKNSSLKFGAQDSAVDLKAASTGEVSAANLKELGASYVILGHSERRIGLKENSKLINKKIKTALKAGLKVVLCVGESASCRKNGDAWKFLSAQLQESLFGVVPEKKGDLLVAYEPVWAIGAGRPMSASEADSMAEKISRLAGSILNKEVPVLYGGSLDSANAPAYLSKKNLFGLLVGGASLEAEEFSRLAS